MKPFLNRKKIAYLLLSLLLLSACSRETDAQPLLSSSTRSSQLFSQQDAWRKSVAMAGGQTVVFPQGAEKETITLPVGHEEKLHLMFEQGASSVTVKITEEQGETFYLFAPNYFESTSATDYDFTLPQVDGTYQVWIEARAVDEKNSAHTLSQDFILVVGSGKASEEEGVLPPIVSDQEAVATLQYHSDEPEIPFSSDLLRTCLQTMRLKPGNKGQNQPLPLKKDTIFTLQKGEEKEVFTFGPDGIQWKGQTYYPQNRIALEVFLQEDRHNEGYLYWDYQYLKELLPFDEADIQVVHFKTTDMVGISKQEIAIEDYQEVFNRPVYVWKDSEKKNNPGAPGNLETWIFTLVDGRRYVCQLAGWNSYLQGPKGEVTVRFFHPFGNAT